MTDAQTTTAGLATRPDPPKDRDSQPVPERIAPILQIALILAEYGRHLATTIQHRALRRGFATIAQFFGTATRAVILPRIHRGIMRAMALERVLLERASRGRDLVVPAPRARASLAGEPPVALDAAAQPEHAAAGQPESAAGAQPEPPAALESAAAAQPAEAPAAPPPRVRRTVEEEPLTFDNMPSMAEIEKEVRRRPFGRTVADICRDLGISPALCLGPFWTMLFDAIHFYRGSVGNLVRDMRQREKQLDREGWKHPNLGFPEETKEGIQRVLGFLIGEPPVNPFRPAPAVNPFRAAAAMLAPVPAVATGPP